MLVTWLVAWLLNKKVLFSSNFSIYYLWNCLWPCLLHMWQIRFSIQCLWNCILIFWFVMLVMFPEDVVVATYCRIVRLCKNSVRLIQWNNSFWHLFWSLYFIYFLPSGFRRFLVFLILTFNMLALSLVILVIGCSLNCCCCLNNGHTGKCCCFLSFITNCYCWCWIWNERADRIVVVVYRSFFQCY